MKKALIAAAIMALIIVIRMILSVTLSEQIAVVFTRVCCTFLFFFLLFTLSTHKSKASN